MTTHLFPTLLRYKQWADRELYAVVAKSFERLSAQDASILLRILDHIHIVDRIFQHHLCGLPHPYEAPRSAATPELATLMQEADALDAWYVAYVGNLAASDIDEPMDVVFTSGKQARMTRGEMLLHVCLHGTYHRGNAGIVLQKNGIAPNDDRLTDFLETAANLTAEDRRVA
jgi:uncharacterized damage-inducible protein DinB